MTKYRFENGLILRQKVRAIVINGNGEILLVRPHGYADGEWTLAGGGVEQGESAHQAMCREIAEELGILRTAELRELAVSNRYIYSDEYREKRALDHDGQNAIMFLARVETGTPLRLQAEEIAEARWFSRADAAGAFPVAKQRAVFEACMSDIQQAA